jgi:8-oxo-dGTP diphosphatase
MKNNKLNNVLFLQKCIIVNNKGQILALKRSLTKDSDRSGCWDLPGGTYELGEDVIDSIKREVKEETSLIISDPQPIYLASGFNHLNQFMSGENVFAVTHVCHTWTGDVIISDEHTEYRWITSQEFLTYDFGDDGGFFKASIQVYIERHNELIH